MSQKINQAAVADDLEKAGWSILAALIDAPLLDSLCAELEPGLLLRQAIREKNRVDGSNDGTVHHILGDHPCFLSLLAQLEQLDPVFRQFFGGNYILNSYGGLSNKRNVTAYVHNVHRDIRFSAKEKRFMLNVLVMLDEFTPENGATHLLTTSHHRTDKPDQEQFLALSDRATGPRGSVLLFDSRLWHATGINNTDQMRRALTLTFTSPFFKPQLDYPRLLGYDKGAGLSPFLKQVIGYNARIPASLEEYYLPVSDRFYQRGQDD